MQIIDRVAYTGPNIFWNRPVIRLELDLGDMPDTLSGEPARVFAEKLLAALPNLAGRAHARSFSQALAGGAPVALPRALQHIALELQNLAGYAASHGSCRALAEPGRHEAIIAYDDHSVAMEAIDLAHKLTCSLLPSDWTHAAGAEAFDWQSAHDAFIRFGQRRALDPGAAALIRAAEGRDIPWIRLNRHNLVQLGHGSRQRRIQTTLTSETRHLAVTLASNKDDANKLLRDLGLPAPRLELARSADEAAAAAKRIGYPVAIRPIEAEHGRGITREIANEDQARMAYDLAAAYGKKVVVAEHTPGQEYRLLVVNGELEAAARLVPAQVVGDGKSTIQQLVDRANRDPRRGIGVEKPLTRIDLDAEAEGLMHRRGVARDTVLPAGETLLLRATGRPANGGEALDVTDSIHPDNHEAILRAVKAIGLDVAGVDFTAAEISKSYRETGGRITDVIAGPSLRPHLHPGRGRARSAAEAIVDMLFPKAAPSRVPIAAVVGANGKTTTARMTGHILKLTGRMVGAATSDGVFIGGERTLSGDYAGPAGAAAVLRDPAVETAVIECAEERLLREGLGFRRCRAAACLGVSAERLGMLGAGSPEEAARVMRIALETADEAAVLNADDPHCLRMAEHCRASCLCYVTMNPNHALVRRHIEAGGRAVVLEEGTHGHTLVYYARGASTPLIWARLIPATLDGKALHNVQNAMFAAAIAFSMGVKTEDIRHGLGTFDNSYYQIPGRANIFDEHGFRVLLDKARTAKAVKAVAGLVARLRPKGRKHCLLAAPGDERAEDIRAIAHQVAGRFDFYICREDDDRRGRAVGETASLLREELIQSGVRPSAIQVIPDERRAVAAILRMAKPDDMALIFGTDIQRCWEQIKDYRPEAEFSDVVGQTDVDEDLAPDFEDFALNPGESMVQDERGVRIARRGG